jgi:hypothetical protein
MKGENYMSDSKSRKRFMTTIDEDIILNFKVACVKNKLDMNEVLEILMKAYSDELINLNDYSE